MAIVASPIDAQHPSSPVYLVAAPAVIAASGSFFTDEVDCGGFAQATVYVVASGTPTVTYLQLSVDGAAWHFLVPHGDSVGPAAFTSSGGVSSHVRRIDLGGARFVRAQVYNTSAGPLTIGVHIALQSGG